MTNPMNPTWWQAMPTSVRTSLVVSAWLFLVSMGTAVVMGLWLLYVLVTA